MSRARHLAALALAGALVAGCGADKSFIPPGSYAGSDASGAEVTLEVGGDVKLGGTKLQRDPVRKRFVNQRKRIVLACTVQRPSKDLACDLTRAGVTEHLELMWL